MTNQERLGPPPIEPLSDAAWSRVERGVWSQLDAAGVSMSEPMSAPSRRWWLVAAPVLAAAAVAAFVIGTRTTTTQVAEEPSRVVSGAAPSSVSFSDSHIELEADTALVMNHEAGHPIALLERGAAWFTVAPRGSRPEFIVRAGDAAVRVVGTRFRVERSDERIAVSVEHGLVDVQFRGRVASVGANQRWSSDSPGQIAMVTGAAPQVSPPEPAEPAAPVIDAPEPAAPSPAARPARKPAAKPGQRPEAKADARLDVRSEPKADPAHAGDVTAIDRDRAEYDRLAALEPRDPAAALAGYMALARGTSRWADPALYAAGRLAADRHDRRAETLLGIYLQRFPSGANATDARELLARLKEAQP